MKDEEYVLRQENRDRAITARSAHSRRTHCGRGGRVKLPSDYMTKKELNAMNGECETYRLNEPMKWFDFMKMPDEHKVTYIKLLRNKFGVPLRPLAEMFGTSFSTVSIELKKLGIASGKSTGRPKWDKEGFLMWVNGVPVEQAELPVIETPGEEPVEVLETKCAAPLIPVMGDVQYEGRIEDILLSLGALLKGAKVSLYVKWMPMEEDDG